VQKSVSPLPPAVCIVLIDEQERILLYRSMNMHVGEFWRSPTGLPTRGETFEEAARRTLRREAGDFAELGPWVWTRTRRLGLGKQDIEQQEHFFVARFNYALNVVGRFR
jgi:hypothetical protein